MGCFRVHHSLSLRSKNSSSSSLGSTGRKAEFLRSYNGGDELSFSGMVEGEKNGNETGNKIMILVDSSLEAKGALDWALSHTVQTQDTVVLLHVVKPSKKDANGKLNLRAIEQLHSMKNICGRKKPGVKVEIELLEGKERGEIIVEEAKKQKVSLLVLGQKRKRSIWWSLMKRMTRKGLKGDVVEYCIQNATCMTIAVRRKSKKLGGYLITTKRHKNFWLLA
ncbi:hypothetical protein UlMin_008458 [Ulmus minor]